MELFLILFVLGFLLCAAVGFIMLCVWTVRALTGARRADGDSKWSSARTTDAERAAAYTAPPASNLCANCGGGYGASDTFCPHCGQAVKVSDATRELLRDLAATRRQVERFRKTGRLDYALYQELTRAISDEHARLTAAQTTKKSAPAPEDVFVVDEGTATHTPPSVIAAPITSAPPAGDFAHADADVYAPALAATYAAPRRREDVPPPAPPPAPSKPFAEVFASFMEERNIRWGELVGGLLIVGCSVALVVSLWSQIARLPLVQFLVFTSVTAALFGTGLYTEHRWKLPMTSRGLLLFPCCSCRSTCSRSPPLR
jgi:hypothetical protein